MKLVIASLLIGCLMSSEGNAAYAESAAVQADQLFKKGKRLLAQKKYPEACAAFEQSDRLDSGIGAKLNIAKCYQEWGKLATAWRWYVDAETMATSVRDGRAQKIHELVEALEPSVPRLTVKAPRGVDLAGVLMTLDGVSLEPSALGVEQRVDPGPHEVITTAGGVRHRQVVPVERGNSAELVLELPSAGRTRDADGATRPSEPASQGSTSSATATVTGTADMHIAAPAGSGRTRRFIGLGVAGAGVVAMGIAGLVTLSARGDYRNAIDDHCQGATDMCDDDGISITHDAAHRANIATVVTLGGLAAVVTGLVVYFTAPRTPVASEHALYLAPAVGAGGGTLVLGGSF
jgi:hypothetical protein